MGCNYWPDSLGGYQTKQAGASVSDKPEKNAPLDTARKRYARGEISKEEFEQIKKDLL